MDDANNAPHLYFVIPIYIGERNLALSKPCRQSSTLWSGLGAERASDGDPATCAVTARDTAPRWWQVHLGEAVRVQTVAVVVSPRPDRLHKFTVFVVGEST